MSNKTFKSKAYDWLKRKIITLEYPMGSPLVESELCQELGMGRTPIREAIHQLETEGLVLIRPRKGTFVSSIDIFDFEDLLDTRIMLEMHVLEKLAGTIRPDQLEKFRALFDDVSQLVHSYDIDKLLKIERDFHEGMVALLENPYLNFIAVRIYDLVARTWYLSFRRRSQESLSETLNDHLDILDALQVGDAQMAKKIATKHIVDFRNKVFN